jgi:acylphosphatase
MAAGGETKCVRVRIEGKVQGVWFRAWTAEEATTRGLHGWVRNRRDGSVEAQLAGPAGKIDDMVAACRRGPPHARVERIIAAPAEDDGEPGFRTLPTV